MIRQSYDCLRFSGTGTLDGERTPEVQKNVDMINTIAANGNKIYF